MGRHGKDETAGLSRRELLQRSAVAGGIVWAAPTLLGSAAGATTPTSCPQGSCPVYHFVKIDGTDPNFPTLANLCTYSFGSPSHCLGSFTAPADATVTSVTCETFKTHVQSISGSTIVLKPGFQFVAAYNKKGPGCSVAPITGNCSTATFVSDPSHIEFVYCGPS